MSLFGDAGRAVAAGGFEVRPVTGIGEVSPGDDLAEVIATAAPWLEDGDILVVTSKIVSKAESTPAMAPALSSGASAVPQDHKNPGKYACSGRARLRKLPLAVP